MQGGTNSLSNLAVTTAGNGNWNTLAFTGGSAAATFNDPVMVNNQAANPPTSNSYNIVTYAVGAINYSAPDILTVSTSASNVAPAVSAPIFGSAQRRITDTAVWLEFEQRWYSFHLPPTVRHCHHCYCCHCHCCRCWFSECFHLPPRRHHWFGC